VSLPLVALLASAAAPFASETPPRTVDAPCGASLHSAIWRLQSAWPDGGAIRLAAHCTWEVDLRLRGDTPLAIIGGEGSRIVGRVVFDGEAPVTIRNVALEGPLTPLVVRGAGPLTLDGVTIRSGDDGVHVQGSGPVFLRASEVVAASTGLWVERAAGLRIVGGAIHAGEQAMVVRETHGPVRVADAHVEVGPASPAPAAVRIEGAGPIELVHNVFVHQPDGVSDGAALLDLDAAGVVAENDFRTAALAVRARQPLSLGCNRFQTLVRTVDGPAERVCARDLAPDRLDWRARVGGPDVTACLASAEAGVCPDFSAAIAE
jgi:hypothetical protein